LQYFESVGYFIAIAESFTYFNQILTDFNDYIALWQWLLPILLLGDEPINLADAIVSELLSERELNEFFADIFIDHKCSIIEKAGKDENLKLKIELFT
jgi:hypothetical protein